jgi:hypothetical protein
MAAWGVLVVILGFLSCRVTLSPPVPLTGGGALLLSVLVLGFSLSIFLGPLFFSTTPAAMQRAAAMPGFQGQDTQRYFDIVEFWGLYRPNPSYPALLGLWAGVSFALVAGLDARPRTLLAAAIGVTRAWASVGARRLRGRALRWGCSRS